MDMGSKCRIIYPIGWDDPIGWDGMGLDSIGLGSVGSGSFLRTSLNLDWMEWDAVVDLECFVR